MNKTAEATKKMTENTKNEIISWIKTLGLALVLALSINGFVIVNATVPSGSMESTIMTDDRIVAFRLSYMFSDPERGDIVVFKFPDDPEQKTLYVKRIIGMPGDTIEIVDGSVYINGSNEPLDEYYLNEPPLGSFGPYTVPEGCYFMLGDNRNKSLDSRYWNSKFVEEDKILGKVFFKYFPGFKVIK